MNARFARLLTLWILPLLVARAFIPAGFMITADAGGLSLEFCSGSTAIAVRHAAQDAHHEASGHAHSAGHDGTTDAGQGHRDLEHEAAPCPFSLGATSTFGELPRAASIALVLSDPILDFLSAPTFSVGPFRSEHIRGPPSVA